MNLSLGNCHSCTWVWLRGIWLVDIEEDAELVTQFSVLTMKVWTVKETGLCRYSRVVKTEEALPLVDAAFGLHMPRVPYSNTALWRRK